MTIADVDLIAKERDRLLHRSVRVIGITMTVVSFLGLAIPGIVDETRLAQLKTRVGEAFLEVHHHHGRTLPESDGNGAK